MKYLENQYITYHCKLCERKILDTAGLSPGDGRGDGDGDRIEEVKNL